MRAHTKTTWMAAALGMAACAACSAQAGILMFNLGSGITLPDDESGGVVNVQTTTGLPTSVQELRVRLQLEGVGAGGMWNGDIYATLTYQPTATADPTAYTVLLNRPGWDADHPDAFPGYADNGMNVSLGVTGPDIHIYQTVQTPALGSALTGSWSADGRDEDPFLVTNGTGRTAGLGAFQGLNLNGVWTLYVEDTMAGAQGKLKGWGLEWTPVTPVPEPASLAGIAGLALLGWGCLRTRRCL